MPKILWMSPYSLHDHTSGASINAKDMLESLVRAGFQVWSCASFIFDNPAGASVFGNLEQKLKEDNHKTFVLDDNGIHYVYTRCQARGEMEFTLEDGQLFYDTFIDILDEFKPDIIIGYCPAPTPMACISEAKRRGISTIYMLVNPNHQHFSFPNYDLVLTDSEATAKFYAARSKINVAYTGAFFCNRQRFLCESREPKYVTFINPSPTKGLPIFAKLAHVCQKELPDVRFLVINSRGVFSQLVSHLHEKGKNDVHPFKATDFPNVDMAALQTDMRTVYRLTKVLVAPSLWFESWGRVTSEAVLNGIPVLASSSGGIPEAIAGGGITIDAPEHCVEDNLSIPTDEEIKPWVEGLKRLLTTDMSAQMAEAQNRLNPDRALERVIEVLMPLYARARRNTNSPLYYY